MTDANSLTFDAALQRFLEMAQERINQYFERYPNLQPDTLSLSPGKRYVKLVQTTNAGQGRSVHSFIDTHPDHLGDVYKPATWRAPARHARGNIFSDSNGGEALTNTGSIRYLS